MEYALGSIITIAVIALVVIFLRRNPIEPPMAVRYSQSHVHNLVAPFLPDNSELKAPPITQSTKHVEQISIKVVFYDNKAYWIKDGVFYVADVMNHEINHDTAIEVDTMTMDNVQLDKIKFVVEKLTEGNQNDSRDAG